MGSMAKFSWKHSLSFANSYPEEISKNIIEKQACLLTKIIVNSATDLFGMTEISNKESNGGGMKISKWHTMS